MPAGSKPGRGRSGAEKISRTTPCIVGCDVSYVAIGKVQSAARYAIGPGTALGDPAADPWDGLMSSEPRPAPAAAVRLPSSIMQMLDTVLGRAVRPYGEPLAQPLQGGTTLSARTQIL